MKVRYAVGKNVWLSLVCVLFAFEARASQTSCFAYAETYYEQVYCEIKQKSPSTVLPAFFDFKKNDARMQAMLLKRKAEALGIAFNMPASKSKKVKSVKRAEARPERPHNQQISAPQSRAECQFSVTYIDCSDGQFSLIGNKANNKIARTALQNQNRLKLNNYRADRADQQQLNLFLTQQYIHYLEKMVEIGLGGATMSFTKFYALFEDISDKGADFSARFETMYEFLKKDKANMSVNERAVSIAGLNINDCAQLTSSMFVCDNRRRNSIYLKR